MSPLEQRKNIHFIFIYKLLLIILPEITFIFFLGFATRFNHNSITYGKLLACKRDNATVAPLEHQPKAIIAHNVPLNANDRKSVSIQA